MFPLAVVAGLLQGHWWGCITETTKYVLSSFLWMFSLLLKELISDFIYTYYNDFDTWYKEISAYKGISAY